jgi:hypothetical protein
MTYSIAIPSYQRAEWLATRTLTTLLAGGVAQHRITVFVHDHDPQLPAYRDIADQTGINLEVTDARGIREQRQRIVNHYPAGARLVCMDDDIQEIIRAVDAKRTEPVANVGAFLEGMFAALDERNLFVWGISPVPNPFYMRPGQLGEGLKLVMFTLFGFINRPGHPVQETTVEYKDEQELSLRAYWWDGAVLRADDVAVKANYYGPGGCSAAGRAPEGVRESQDSLLAQWPGYARENTKKDSGWPEMSLVFKRRHEGKPLHVPPPGFAAYTGRGV